MQYRVYPPLVGRKEPSPDSLSYFDTRVGDGRKSPKSVLSVTLDGNGPDRDLRPAARPPTAVTGTPADPRTPGTRSAQLANCRSRTARQRSVSRSYALAGAAPRPRPAAPRSPPPRPPPSGRLGELPRGQRVHQTAVVQLDQRTRMELLQPPPHVHQAVDQRPLVRGPPAASSARARPAAGLHHGVR